MTTTLDQTHDPSRKSWVESANAPGAEFPVQNLPFGVFSRGGGGPPRVGVAIGDAVFDLRAAGELGLLTGPEAEAVAGPTLNPLMAMGRPASARLRAAVSDLLRHGGAGQAEADRLLVPMAGATLHLPAQVANFTDFMVSRDHTARMGALKNPEAPLPPAFPHLPIGYHSRASSLRVSGTPVVRPNGQRGETGGRVAFGPERRLDFELELAVWIAGENALGVPLGMREAASRIFGYGLLNDWSAREIQMLEMAPLGPFLGKSFCTTVSPWIVTADAMAPFATAAAARGEGDPPVPGHLDSKENRRAGGLSLAMEALLLTAAMRRAGEAPARVAATDFAAMYWTPAQLVAHHASNGCNLLPGDLLGSGTCSGADAAGRACLAEIAATGGVRLPNGEERRFLEDGDEVVFRARAHAPGAVPIGFGECRAVVQPAPAWPGA